jgi:hypothetical protein
MSIVIFSRKNFDYENDVDEKCRCIEMKSLWKKNFDKFNKYRNRKTQTYVLLKASYYVEWFFICNRHIEKFAATVFKFFNDRVILMKWLNVIWCDHESLKKFKTNRDDWFEYFESFNIERKNSSKLWKSINFIQC